MNPPAPCLLPATGSSSALLIIAIATIGLGLTLLKLGLRRTAAISLIALSALAASETSAEAAPLPCTRPTTTSVAGSPPQPIAPTTTQADTSAPTETTAPQTAVPQTTAPALLGSISGIHTRQSELTGGQPVVGATVDLIGAGPDDTFGTSDDTTTSTTTDTTGRYTFNNLTPDQYRLAAGSPPLDESMNVTWRGAPANQVEFSGTFGSASGINLEVRSAGIDGVFDTADDGVGSTTTNAGGQFAVLAPGIGNDTSRISATTPGHLGRSVEFSSGNGCAVGEASTSAWTTTVTTTDFTIATGTNVTDADIESQNSTTRFFGIDFVCANSPN
jgi:hypothetical protein